MFLREGKGCCPEEKKHDSQADDEKIIPQNLTHLLLLSDVEFIPSLREEP